MIAYLFLHYGRKATSAFAFGQGFLFDLYSGGLHGLFTSLYLIVFLGIYLGTLSFNLQDAKGQILIVLIAMVSKQIALLALTTIFSLEAFSLKYYLWPLVLSALITALTAPFVFYLLDGLKTSFMIGEPRVTAKSR